MAKISCIYKISNLINGKIYIGSAADFNKRKSNHLRQLNTNSHHSKYLQNSWNKNGPEIFSFSILEVVDDINNLLEREQHYLDSLLFAKEKNCKFNNLGYNICRKAGSFTGVKHSEKTKKILSLKNIGKKHSESTRKKMSKSLGNVIAPSEMVGKFGIDATRYLLLTRHICCIQYIYLLLNSKLLLLSSCRYRGQRKGMASQSSGSSSQHTPSSSMEETPRKQVGARSKRGTRPDNL